MYPRETLDYQSNLPASTIHENDHYVTLKCNKTFVEKAQNASAAPFFSLSKKSIGSYFQKGGSPSIATGLDPSEVNLLMENILDIPPADREFRKEVTKFFEKIFTPVDHDKGTKLNIGKEKENSSPISKDNMPLNVMDYIRFRHAQEHPWVAKNPEAAKGNQGKKFYIDDEAINASMTSNLGDQKDKALELYLSLKNNEDKVNMMLTLLGIDPVLFTSGKPGSKLSIKQVELRRLADTNPKQFLDKHGIDNFDERFLTMSLVNAKIWSQVSGQFLDANSNKLLATSDTGAVVWLKDPKNSNVVSIYKAKLAEYNRRGDSPKAVPAPPATAQEPTPPAPPAEDKK